MSHIEEQFEYLRGRYSGARLTALPDGSHVVEVPSVPLPHGWSKATTTVWFVAPVGYPLAKPDCFWADDDLRLANGAMPQSTNLTPIPGVPGSARLWFSWHGGRWNANHDNLLSYKLMIEARLREAK